MRREAAETKKGKERGEPCSSPTNQSMAKIPFLSLLVRTSNVLKSKKREIGLPNFGNVVTGSILRNWSQIFKFPSKNGTKYFLLTYHFAQKRMQWKLCRTILHLPQFASLFKGEAKFGKSGPVWSFSIKFWIEVVPYRLIDSHPLTLDSHPSLLCSKTVLKKGKLEKITHFWKAVTSFVMHYQERTIKQCSLTMNSLAYLACNLHT